VKAVQLAIFVPIALFAASVGVGARASSFGGNECAEDCSGHAAGYDWAEQHDIDDPDDCPQGNSQSFHEGCRVYTEDPMRGSDEDDDGNPIDK